MKKVVAVIALAFLLAGCGNRIILDEVSKDLYCDKEYNVQYVYFSAGNQNSVLSVRLDSNGKPIPCFK